MDHWDAPILASLAFLGNGPATNMSASICITNFIGALSAARSKAKSSVKLLVIGNLPLFNDPKMGFHGWTNISSHKTIAGAFGIINSELVSLATVLSHNRRTKVDLFENGYIFKFGYFCPPSLLPDDSPRHIFNFDLVLHHIATTLNLDSPHKTLADSPSLKIISQRCKSLLQHSSLRRERPTVITPFHGISSASLFTIAKDERALRMLLLYLGAIRVTKAGEWTDKGEQIGDLMWTVEMCSLFAHIQVCPNVM
jgi:hypothetical protein